ncbi:MAG: substrate-binding domain-containing protein [Anaerolineales bacterium]
MSFRTNRSIILLLAILALVGCSQSPTATPTIPAIPTVHASPFALPLARSLAQPYMEEVGPLPFDLIPAASQAALQSTAQDEAALHLDYLPVPEGWFTTPLGWEGAAVVVNSEVPLRSLTLADLADIFSGRAEDWQEFGRGEGAIQVVVPPQGERMRSLFVEAVLPNGQVTTRARLAPTPDHALQLVAELDGAIGLIPAHSSTQGRGVAVVRVEGQLPEGEALQEGGYPLRWQILAMAPEEPDGSVREWLTWVQSTDS